MKVVGPVGWTQPVFLLYARCAFMFNLSRTVGVLSHSFRGNRLRRPLLFSFAAADVKIASDTIQPCPWKVGLRTCDAVVHDSTKMPQNCQEDATC